MAEKPRSHVVATGDGTQAGAKCLNCGGWFNVSTPVNLTMFSKMGKMFADDHEQCAIPDHIPNGK